MGVSLTLLLNRLLERRPEPSLCSFLHPAPAAGTEVHGDHHLPVLVQWRKIVFALNLIRPAFTVGQERLGDSHVAPVRWGWREPFSIELFLTPVAG